MDPLRIAIRAAAAFFYLLAMMRLSGKNVVSHNTPFDFVLGLIIGDLIDDFLFVEVPAAQFVVALGTLVMIDLFIKVWSFHSDAFRFLVDGRATVIFKNGNYVAQGMRDELIKKADLLALLRLKGFDEEKHHEIKLAAIEDSGQVSVLKDTASKTVQKSDKNKPEAE